MAHLTRALVLTWLVGAAGAAPTSIARVDDVIDAPRALFGRTRAEIERRLGPPTTTRAVRLGTAGPAAEELAYPGLVLRLAGPALARVRLSSPAWHLPHGLGVGATRRHVEATLGEPQGADDTRVMYLYSDGYPDTVEFRIRDGRVERIEWTYWVD